MLDKGSAVAGRPSRPGRLWDLKLGASLELGVWSLELGVFTNPPNQKALPQPERCRSFKARTSSAEFAIRELAPSFAFDRRGGIARRIHRPDERIAFGEHDGDVGAT